MRESIKSVCIAVFLFATVATPFAWLWDRPGFVCWSIRLGGPLLDVIAVWLIFKLERKSSVTSEANPRQASRPKTSRSSSGDPSLADEEKERKRCSVGEISGDSADSFLRQWERNAETVDHAATTESVLRNPWSDPRDKAIMAAILIFGVACGAVSYWYYGDSSARPEMLSFVVFGFTGYLPAHLFAVQVNKRFEARFKDEMRRLSVDLNLGLESFRLFSVGSFPRLSNLKRGTIDGIDVAVFDYQFARVEGKRNRTVCCPVVWLQRRRVRLPTFFIQPSSWLTRDLFAWAGGRDHIHFESHPAFSKKYLLSGDDEDAIRELFTDEVLTFFEQHEGRSTESAGDKLIFYRDAINVEPVRIQSLLHESLQLLSLFPKV